MCSDDQKKGLRVHKKGLRVQKKKARVQKKKQGSKTKGLKRIEGPKRGFRVQKKGEGPKKIFEGPKKGLPLVFLSMKQVELRERDIRTASSEVESLRRRREAGGKCRGESGRLLKGGRLGERLLCLFLLGFFDFG